MANNVIAPNPFGELSISDLEQFERSLGCTLPSPYRNYLIRFNGGRPKNDIVHISASEGDTRIHHMYGLHRGPAYARLVIGGLPEISRDYLAICDDALGNHFLIQLKEEGAGRIYFHDHERSEPALSPVLIADDFDQFVSSMSSEDQHMSDFRRRVPDGYREFQERLREMKRLRAEEVKKSQ